MVSASMKNMDLSGDPQAGSVAAKRFVNATGKAYGTARTALKGDAVKAQEVTVPINVDREMVEEIEQKDIKLLGVDGLLTRRAANHALRMASELDTAFFLEAYHEGAQATLTETDDDAKLEELIQVLETTKNDFVDGVPREMITVVLSTKWYGKVRGALDKISKTNVDSTVDEFEAFHGARIAKSIHLPSGVDAIAMVDGAVAQPVMSDQYTAEKIPLSNAWGVELFYHYGTKAVTPDLIAYVGTKYNKPLA